MQGHDTCSQVVAACVILVKGELDEEFLQ